MSSFNLCSCNAKFLWANFFKRDFFNSSKKVALAHQDCIHFIQGFFGGNLYSSVVQTVCLFPPIFTFLLETQGRVYFGRNRINVGRIRLIKLILRLISFAIFLRMSPPSCIFKIHSNKGFVDGFWKTSLLSPSGYKRPSSL